jgi:hypothetical protein
MRVLSLIIAAGYVLLTLIGGLSQSVPTAIGSALLVSAVLLVPLACIWYGDEVGGYVGMLPGPAINRATPGVFVKVGGWVLLLLPVVVFCLFRP